MAVSTEDLDIDPQATIDALLAQQSVAMGNESPIEAASEMPEPELSINLGSAMPGLGLAAAPDEDKAPPGEYLHAGAVPPLPTVERPEPTEATTRKPDTRPQQDVFSRAALTYALSPSHSKGNGDQRAGDEAMDLVTIAGLAQWAHGVLQRYGKEYLAAILEISQLTGRISKDTQEIIMTISPLLESASTDRGLVAKQIVSMLAQLDAFLGTVSASDSRLLPFLLQDDMEVFPLIRP